MVRLINRFWAVCLVAILLPASGMAQNAYSAAYRVNESIISHFDISQRVKMMRVLGANGSGLRQTAVDALIDERLQVELAHSFGIEIRPEELARSIENYAQQRNMSTERLLARMRGRGVSQEAFEEFITASLLWRQILRSRFGDQANPTLNELNSHSNTVAVSSSSSIQLGEIALLYTERGQEGTVNLANQLLSQLRNGENFQTLARQYSRARSAENGGVIGWVSPGRLPPQLNAAVRGLGRGQVADLIFVPTGVIIIKVLNTRTQSRQILIPTKINVTYAHLILPHNAGEQANAIQQADRLRRSLDGCRGLEARSAEFSPDSGIIGPVPLGDVAADIGLNLARLEPRDSAVMTGENHVSILVLCDRVSEISDESRAALRNQLFGQNMQSLAEGYLLELRRTSIIEKQ